MKSPYFWQADNCIAAILTPLSFLYAIGYRLQQRLGKFPVTLPVPTICIGNLTVGGAGKTPVALYVGEYIKRKNIRAYFLSRGYGGHLSGPIEVNPSLHSAREVGDEPLLLSRVLPTIVAKDRIMGAMLAIERGAKAIIMDDGFQNTSIAKTLSLLVIDGTYGFGNGKLLPAGPLRELPEEGFRRAHGVIVINPATNRLAIPLQTPAFSASIQPTGEAAALKDKNIWAFCGIGIPQKFYDTLEALGANIVGRSSFPDHYAYTESNITTLVAEARRKNALLVTTAKDAVRLSPELRPLAAIVDITLRFENPTALEAMLDKALKQL